MLLGTSKNLNYREILGSAVFPDFELDVDVASEVAEGCADAVPVADCIIVVGLVALGDVDAEVIKQVFDAVSCDCRENFVGVGCCHFFEFWDCVLSSLIFSSRRCF